MLLPYSGLTERNDTNCMKLLFAFSLVASENQRFNKFNVRQTEWDIKRTAQNMKRRYKYWDSKYKRRHGWTNLKKIETDHSCVFKNLFASQVFKVQCFVVCITFDIMLGRHICLTLSCNFTISNFSSSIANKTNKPACKWTRQRWHNSFKLNMIDKQILIDVNRTRSFSIRTLVEWLCLAIDFEHIFVG